MCTAPFPSMPVAFWNDPDGAKYRAAYFETYPNVWRHGDWAELTERGGMIIYGRSDATLNPGGVRIGTAEIYRQVEQLPEIVESIVIGQDMETDGGRRRSHRLVRSAGRRSDADRRAQRAHPRADSRQREPASRSEEDHSGRRHSAHDQRKDHRARGARRRAWTPGEERRCAGESRGARAVPRLAGARDTRRNHPAVQRGDRHRVCAARSSALRGAR